MQNIAIIQKFKAFTLVAAGENNCPIIAEYVNMPASFRFMRAKRTFYFDSICVNRNYIVVAKYFVGREMG